MTIKITFHSRTSPIPYDIQFDLEDLENLQNIGLARLIVTIENVIAAIMKDVKTV